MVSVRVGGATGDPGRSVRESTRVLTHGNRGGAVRRGARYEFAAIPVQDIILGINRPRVIRVGRYSDLDSDVALHLHPRAAGLHLVHVMVSVGIGRAFGDPGSSVGEPTRIRSKPNRGCALGSVVVEVCAIP